MPNYKGKATGKKALGNIEHDDKQLEYQGALAARVKERNRAMNARYKARKLKVKLE